MRILIAICSVLLVLTLSGCAYNHPNAILRDMSYGATIGALPGLAMMSVTPTVEEDDVDIDTELGFFGLSLAVTGIGAVGGFVIGTVVGIFHWMYETATWQPPPEPLPPPQRIQTTPQVQEPPRAVRNGESAVYYQEDIDAEYAPQAVR